MTTNHTYYSIEEWIVYLQDEDSSSGQLQKILAFHDFVNDDYAPRESRTSSAWEEKSETGHVTSR